MKIKDGFMLRKVGGQSVVVATGDASKSFNGIIKLNETGALMWNTLAVGCDETGLLKAVLDEYNIDENTAKADISAFIEKLKGADLLDL
ncbi:MAG: PqqD family protein [Ruminococcus sp.]|nr:PqqD family protein [Ruminococcus sp.]